MPFFGIDTKSKEKVLNCNKSQSKNKKIEEHLKNDDSNSENDNKGDTGPSHLENITSDPLSRSFQSALKIKVWLFEFFKFLFEDRVVKENPFDTLLLKTHYVFASKLFLALFIYSTSSWFAEEPIICIDLSDRSSPPEEIIQYCLNYPYTEIAANANKNVTRHYALHYRWVHIGFLILAFIYMSAKLTTKMLEFKELRKLLEELHECNVFSRFKPAKIYYTTYIGRHGGMYGKFLCAHVISLGINVLGFICMNITLQNNYWNLPLNLAIERDPGTFDDAYSLIFPPFTKCEIAPDQHIFVERTKRYGCHLTLMEVYEKIFMALWFFQVFLALWNIVFLMYHVSLPCLHKWRVNLLLEGGGYSYFEPFQSFADKYTVSELFAIGCVQHLLLGKDYIQLLNILDCDELQDLDETLYYEETEDSKLPPYILSRKNPPVGFEALQTPFKLNRRFSESFECSSRQSMGFETQKDAKYFTPMKEDYASPFYTPMKETPERKTFDFSADNDIQPSRIPECNEITGFVTNNSCAESQLLEKSEEEWA